MSNLKIAELLQIEIPANVFVSCPKTGNFQSVSVASHCVGCEHFLGMVEIDGDKAPFAERYRVQCHCPLSRRMTAVSL